MSLWFDSVYLSEVRVWCLCVVIQFPFWYFPLKENFHWHRGVGRVIIILTTSNIELVFIEKCRKLNEKFHWWIYWFLRLVIHIIDILCFIWQIIDKLSLIWSIILVQREKKTVQIGQKWIILVQQEKKKQCKLVRSGWCKLGQCAPQSEWITGVSWKIAINRKPEICFDVFPKCGEREKLKE